MSAWLAAANQHVGTDAFEPDQTARVLPSCVSNRAANEPSEDDNWKRIDGAAMAVNTETFDGESAQAHLCLRRATDSASALSADVPPSSLGFPLSDRVWANLGSCAMIFPPAQLSDHYSQSTQNSQFASAEYFNKLN